MNSLFWKDKKVFITGHTGFKGSWLTLLLQSMGAEVSGFSLQPEQSPNLFEVANLKTDIQNFYADIRNFDDLSHAIHISKPDIVFHLAAQSLVRPSYKNPIETYSTNVMGTVNLLEVLRQIQCAKAAVIVTSDKCYDNREWYWGYRENDPIGGRDPYSSSKGCAELVTHAYHHSYFAEQQSLHIASARAGNVIGGGDWAVDRLIPDFLRAISSNQPLKIRYPQAIRPWQHVLEPLTGYLMLAENLWIHGEGFTGSWNFGPDDDDIKNVEWIASFMTKCWGAGATWEVDSEQKHYHEAHYLKLDTSKAKLKLTWKPRWKLEQALTSIVTWHQAFNDKNDMKKIMLEQINEYLSS